VAEPPAWPAVTLALAAALLFQTTLGPAFALRGAVVSWILLLVIWYGFRTGWGRGLFFGLIAGACEDALSPLTAPAWTFATALIGAAAGRAGSTFVAESRAWLVPFVVVATLLRYAVFGLIMHLERRPLGESFHTVLWQSALDGLVALALMLVFPQLRGRYAADS